MFLSKVLSHAEKIHEKPQIVDTFDAEFMGPFFKRNELFTLDIVLLGCQSDNAFEFFVGSIHLMGRDGNTAEAKSLFRFNDDPVSGVEDKGGAFKIVYFSQRF